MAKILRTCGLLLYFIIYVCATDETASEPRIVSINVKELSCFGSNCKYLLDVRGGEYLGHLSWRLTPEEAPRGGSCDVIYANYELREIVTDQWKTTLEIVVPNSEGKIYFCLYYSVKKNSPFGGRWMHQGGNLFLNPKNDVVSPKKDELSTAASTNEQQQIEVDTQKSNLQETNTEWGDLSHDTDVNYLPNVPRPTRNERRDIEVFFKNKYIPLNAVYGFKNDLKASDGVDEFNDKVGVKFDKDKTLFKSYDNFFYDIDTFKSQNDAMYIKKRSNGIRDMSTQTYSADLEVKKIDLFDTMENKVMLNILKEREIKDTLPNIDNNRMFSNHIDGFKSQNDAIYSENSLNLNQHVKKRPMPTQTHNEDLEKNYLDKVKSKPNISNVIKIRDKREIIKPLQNIESNDTLISAKDILEAKIHKENEIKTVRNEELHEDALIRIRKERQTSNAAILDFTSVKTDPVPIKIEGLRVENSEKEPKLTENGIPSVLADTRVTIRLFGQGFTSRTVISFTYDPSNYGELCKFILKGEHLAKKDSVTSNSVLFELKAPAPETESNILYICAKNLKSEMSDPSKEDEIYIHQGKDPWIALATHNKLLPLWMTLTLILICLMFSALFSGLNLGLMSLDRTELKIISNTGTERERKYARAIMPVRDHGNYLLCSILLGNVAVNSTFTILLDELTSGLFAVIFSTLAIVLLGEITPQAICSRHGLMVGAKSIMVTKAVMALTAPLAYPVSKLLDYFLGEEIGSVYNRERLKELVKLTTDVNDLDKEEVNIISGALELRKKTVSDVMTKLEDVFMLPTTSVLDFETMSEIIKSGYSRIPVYEGSRTNIVTVLFIKDLAFVDPDDNTPLQTLCQYYQNPCNFVFEDVTLDVMFKQFKDGHKGHMAFVHRINNEGEGDPFYETIGLVTLEDVIEEMIQSEIVDETDVFMDNRTKRRRNRPQNKLQDFAAFAERHENQRIHISPQLTLATFQFLSTSVDAFRPDTISETVLRRLFKQDVIQYIKLKGKTKKDPSTYVYQQGKPVDYFVLILEGRVEVTVGRENLVFEAGPFTYFGVQALTQNIGVAESPTPSAMGSLQNINMDSMLRHTFVPDYSVRATAELYYLTVKRSLYLAAKRATLMEKGALSKGATNEQFDTEVDKQLFNSSSANMPFPFTSRKLPDSTMFTKDAGILDSMSPTNKLLQSVDEDISISGEHKTPSRQVSPNPQPVSASPHTRSSFASRASPEPRNGDLYSGARADEQEKLLK